jgi:hypothetical protein
MYGFGRSTDDPYTVVLKYAHGKQSPSKKTVVKNSLLVKQDSTSAEITFFIDATTTAKIGSVFPKLGVPLISKKQINHHE